MKTISSSDASAESSAPKPALPGMGALPLPDNRGVAFRVWAPNAEWVALIGSFNDWDKERHRMVQEEGGTWYLVVPEAKVGDEYRYFLRHGGNEFYRVDPRARKVTNSIGNGIVWQAEAEKLPEPMEPPLMDAAVIYEMHIGSFAAQGVDGPGTFATAIEKLPYLKDLGINVVELMPVAEFAGDFSWGYNPAHPFAVESAYGGPEGLQAFVKAAHEHGIAVILDVVYNHFGPGDASMWQFDGWSENGLGGIYFYNDGRATTPWGDSRPDYGRGEVRTYLRDNAVMWLEDFGIDGLRWDATVYIRSFSGRLDGPADDLKEGWGLIQYINDEVHKHSPRAILIAEDLRDSEWLVKGTGAGGAGFNAQWDAAFVHPVRDVLAAPHDEQRNLDAIIAALKTRYADDAFRRVVYSESHDEVANGKQRLPSEINPECPDDYAARKRSTLGAALVFTAPGIPMIFQGQEFLEAGWFQDHVPMKWEKRDQFSGIHAFYRDLIALRRNLAGHSAGLMGQHVETHHVDHAGKVLGYRRWRDGGAGDDVVVVMNLSHEPKESYAVGVPSGGLWKVRLNSDGHAYSADFHDHPAPDMEAIEEPLDGCSHRIVTGLGPYSVLILSQDPGE